MSTASKPLVWRCGTQNDLKKLLAKPCPMIWEKLEPTDSTSIRHCPVCDRNVHYCDTPAQFVELAKQRECVAIPTSLHIPASARCGLGVPLPWDCALEATAKRWWKAVGKVQSSDDGRLFAQELSEDRVRMIKLEQARNYLVGVDCSADSKKVGLALGYLDSENKLVIEETVSNRTDYLTTLLKWISDHKPSLLAFDAPLGWPEALGKSLATHIAGSALPHEAEELFRRNTDYFVKEMVLRRLPLAVGADKIAHTAVSALQLVDLLRHELGPNNLPLLWDPGIPKNTGLIEVYPAATLRAYGFISEGYKGHESRHERARGELIVSLSQVIAFSEKVNDKSLGLEEGADKLDAVVCVLAAADFARKTLYLPTDSGASDPMSIAKKEGWIWFYRGPPNEP